MTKNPKCKTDGTKIFQPDTRLKEKVNEDIGTLITEENIKAANDVIERESKKFPEAMFPDLQKLAEMCTELANFDFKTTNQKHDFPAFEDIKTTCLSIKSISAMYGYELASNIARSMFNYCESRNCTSNLSKKIITVHSNALNVIFHQNIKGAGGVQGEELSLELKELLAQDTSTFALDKNH